MNDIGVWIQGKDNVAKEACDYYQNNFTGKKEKINEEMLQCIPDLISLEHNSELDKMPDVEELKNIIMSMNPTSAPGPDGIGGKFYQVCFDIIQGDLMAVVNAFFNGNMLPRYMTNACLVLIPKVNHPNKLKDYRPVSLSNFTNKIISKILSTRLASILPNIVSDNQSGFVKGRSISENIMLAQKIIHGIKLPKEGRNAVIKFYMVKAYDRVWIFHSTRGLKQGDPLSPALFIIGAEVLSRNLNLIYTNQLYRGFNMEKKAPQINHLSFADDIIIFTSTDRRSLHLIMKVIEDYERGSDQKVNKDKSFFMVTSKTSQEIIEDIKLVTGFNRKNRPINYLGCPIYIGGQRIIYFSEVVDKVIKRIARWQSKILNFGGKTTLVKHVLQAIPIHTLASMSPLKTTQNYIKKVMADFLWGVDKDCKKYHWASWDTLSYPSNESGIGIRLLEDICKAFQYKHWWEFKTKKSLWSQFLRAKYCQRANSVAKKYNTGDSIVWRCAVKYGGKNSSTQKVKYSIFKDIMQAIKLVFPNIPWQSSWDNLINIIEQCKQQYNIIVVGWNKLHKDIYKINTDGSALQESGKIGGGGILRDHQGKLIYAFSFLFGFATNNMAELRAAAYGIDWHITRKFYKITLQQSLTDPFTDRHERNGTSHESVVPVTASLSDEERKLTVTPSGSATHDEGASGTLGVLWWEEASGFAKVSAPATTVHPASSAEAYSSESTPSSPTRALTSVSDQPNRWCVDGQYQFYSDAKFLNEKEVMTRTLTLDSRVLTGSLLTMP
nr:uncharacterized protein LOC104649583 [Solanum lycopersicum]